jgi:hypothetical protein
MLLLRLATATRWRRGSGRGHLAALRNNRSQHISSSTIDLKQDKKQFFSNPMPRGTRNDEKNV